MSKDRLARLCFAVTFAIAGFSFGLQFVQDWLGVWDEPLLAVSCLFWLGDRWLPGRRPDEAVSKRERIQARRA
jgi:hypothetical protein